LWRVLDTRPARIASADRGRPARTRRPLSHWQGKGAGAQSGEPWQIINVTPVISTMTIRITMAIPMAQRRV
jgi:hypothetical protein